MSEHIMITCPTASIPVRTGYRAPAGSPIESWKRIKLHRCPRCDQPHFWDGKDAFWEKYVAAAPGRWDGLREKLRKSLNVLPGFSVRP